MSKEIKEIKEMKATVLDMATEVCFRLGAASEKVNVSFEKSVLQKAMVALADETTDDRVYCERLLNVYYLVLGMGRDFGGAI